MRPNLTDQMVADKILMMTLRQLNGGASIVAKFATKTLGQKLWKLRSKKGLTQKEVGHHLGMTGSGYSHYENGRVCMALDNIPRFAEALGATEEELLHELGLTEYATAPTIEVIVRDIMWTNELPDDDKDTMIRLIRRLSLTT